MEEEGEVEGERGVNGIWPVFLLKQPNTITVNFLRAYCCNRNSSMYASDKRRSRVSPEEPLRPIRLITQKHVDALKVRRSASASDSALERRCLGVRPAAI